MQIHCRSCDSPIPADDVSVQTALAKCRACHAVFSISDMVPGDRVSTAREHVDLPTRFTISRDAGALVLEWPWRHPKHLFLLVFAFMWDGFLVVWYTMATAAKAPLAFKLFPLIHVAVGFAITYGAICGLVNRTRIEVRRGRLLVRHAPLPAPGAHDLGGRELKQLWSKERISRSKNGTSVSYEVHGKLHGGKHITLVKGLNAPEQALFIEQEVERQLRIEDKPVAGELPR